MICKDGPRGVDCRQTEKNRVDFCIKIWLYITEFMFKSQLHTYRKLKAGL